ncbi:lipopolysaccharide biosynthesis protein [Paenibacillus sp. VMFN-D1]|uniref:lipopolysaccharide biosynthesis protein n=1 Tax=Paenibacillus sp. VMFN-D1 TaxID=2135608 RepID=UPI000E21ED53|nr:oligosaccharide flippase family protein [Paenibacillus sp. VMFN-D1]RED41582.1 O-antigen/teichoic acid export membrane protein [Paenibacillus sp. VMFN-D1]
MENKKILSNGVAYFCSSLMTQMVNLILIPLYTRNLSQQQYGQYDIILSIQQLLALGITLGVYSGMVRFYHEYDNKLELRNTAVNFSLLWGLAFILVTWAVNPWIYPHVFVQLSDSSHLFIPYVVMSSVLACHNLIYTSYYTMQFKALLASSIQIATVVFTLVYALYFFLVLKMGVLGILQAQLFGHLTVFVLLFLIHIRQYRFRLSIRKLRMMLGYGTGLMIGDVSAWVLSLSDRFLIQGFLNLSSVAVYSIGYKIGMLINPVFINPFMSVFTPFKYAMYKETAGPEQIRKMFRLYNFVGWLCVLGLSLFANLATQLVATEAYRDANYIIPIVAISYFLAGAADFYALGLHIARKMKLYSIIIITAALINVGCNLALIPLLGLYGSAISTVIAYMASNYLFYRFGTKYYSIGLGLLFPYKYLTVTLPIYGIYFVSMQVIHSVLLEILFNGILCCGFVYLCLLCKLVTRAELGGMIRQVLKQKSNMSMKGVQSEL